MTRAKTVPARKARTKKVFKFMKGARGGRRRLYRTAKETMRRAMKYSFRDRRVKKRLMRGLWIARINARLREKGLTYSRFIAALQKAKVAVDRKMLAEMAVNDRATFDSIVETVMKK